MTEVSLDSGGRVDDWEEYGAGICARGGESVSKHLISDQSIFRDFKVTQRPLRVEG